MSTFIGSMLPEAPKRKSDELQLSKAVAVFLRFCLQEDTFWFHIPNGGKRQDAIARQLAAMGVKAGVPDLCLLHRGRAHFIELKIDTGYLSPVQKQVHGMINRAGCRVAVCRSIPDVEAALTSWGVPLRGETAPRRSRKPAGQDGML